MLRLGKGGRRCDESSLSHSHCGSKDLASAAVAATERCLPRDALSPLPVCCRRRGAWGEPFFLFQVIQLTFQLKAKFSCL